MEENTRQVINNLETQLNHRLEKLWNVFSWCSSVLISITGGVLLSAGSKEFHLSARGLVLVSIVIIILTAYAWAWIRENLDFEKNIRDELDTIYREQLKYEKLNSLRPDRAKFGYKVVIMVLGLIALAATWIDKVFIMPES